MAISFRLIEEGPRGPLCEPILRALPDWFGIEESLQEYVRDVDSLPTWLAENDGQPIGLLALRSHNPHTAEIHVMAVLPAFHRAGIGRALVAAAELYARAGGHALLEVKTVGPSSDDPFYARTRAFYASVGFFPVEEIPAIWGPRNPCLIQVKPLQP